METTTNFSLVLIAECPSQQVTPLWKKIPFASLEKHTTTRTFHSTLNNTASQLSPSAV